MAAEFESLVLEQLRRIRASQDEMRLELAELKTRMSAVDEIQGQILVMMGAMNKRMDRFEERLGRIERRLDLVDA